jgi:hypothetical protein
VRSRSRGSRRRNGRRCCVERAQPIGAGGVEIDQPDPLTHGEIAHRLRVQATGVEQLAAIEFAARYRRDQQQPRAAVASEGHVAHQPHRKGFARLVVAAGIFEFRIVMAELDQHHIAVAQFLLDAVQPALLDETARTAAALSVIAHLPCGGIEKTLQLLAPSRSRCTLWAVFAGGGIASDEDAAWHGISLNFPQRSRCL